MNEKVTKVLFGNTGEEDVKRWESQGFEFYEVDGMFWGLRQRFGGPCGVLAVVQGFLLKYLLFEAKLELETVTKDIAEQALVNVLSSILLSVKPESQSHVVIEFPDAEAEELHLPSHSITEYIKEHIQLFQSPKGVVAFIFSVLLTRGLELVQSDRDDPSQPLVQRFGHSSQDLVNLLLCGRAVSNVHDGVKFVGSPGEQWEMGGIPFQLEIGYLTVLESLRYSKVGDFMKVPKYPIWVIGSQSHFTVAFGMDQTIGKVSDSEQFVMNARRIFSQFDPFDNGFVPIEKTPELLQAMQLSPQDRVKIQRNLDPEQMGVILWGFFIEAFKSVQNNANDAEWNCSACTYLNKKESNNCEICSSEKPDISLVPMEEDNGGPIEFKLYHFNGLESRNGSPPQLTSINVFLTEDSFARTDTPEPGLREVLQTRWSTSTIEYDGAEPRMN